MSDLCAGMLFPWVCTFLGGELLLLAIPFGLAVLLLLVLGIVKLIQSDSSRA
jgi:hypothetical protein